MAAGCGQEESGKTAMGRHRCLGRRFVLIVLPMISRMPYLLEICTAATRVITRCVFALIIFSQAQPKTMLRMHPARGDYLIKKEGEPMMRHFNSPPIDIPEEPSPPTEGDPEDPGEWRCACGAPAAWEVPFAAAPHYEYYCAACMPDAYWGTPVYWPANVCTNCDGPHPVRACPAIRARLFTPTRYLCDSCGDPIIVDGLCRACVEVGERDAWGISLDLRASIREDAQRREVVDGVLASF